MNEQNPPRWLTVIAAGLYHLFLPIILPVMVAWFMFLWALDGGRCQLNGGDPPRDSDPNRGRTSPPCGS